MKRLVALLSLVVLLLMPACRNGSEPAASPDASEETEKKDAGTRAGEAIEGAKDRAQELTDEENKRVDDVNAQMDE